MTKCNRVFSLGGMGIVHPCVTAHHANYFPATNLSIWHFTTLCGAFIRGETTEVYCFYRHNISIVSTSVNNFEIFTYFNHCQFWFPLSGRNFHQFVTLSPEDGLFEAFWGHNWKQWQLFPPMGEAGVEYDFQNCRELSTRIVFSFTP